MIFSSSFKMCQGTRPRDTQEIMMNLFENCGLSTEMAAVETLFLDTHSNMLKMAEWLQSRGYKTTLEEIEKEVGTILKEVKAK